MTATGVHDPCGESSTMVEEKTMNERNGCRSTNLGWELNAHIVRLAYKVKAMSVTILTVVNEKLLSKP